MSSRVLSIVGFLVAAILGFAAVFFFVGCAEEPSESPDEIIETLDTDKIGEPALEGADLDSAAEFYPEGFTNVHKVEEIIESSTLPYDDYYNYVGKNVVDLDYNSSWCVSGSDPEPWLNIQFKEPMDFAEFRTFGLVPGFARDPKIYGENNRVKTFEIHYGAMGGIVETYEVPFSTEPTMFFFELPEQAGPWSSLQFVVTDVYEGSKYSDTCIAEIDFWSPWVEAQNAYAPYEFYLSKYMVTDPGEPTMDDDMWTILDYYWWLPTEYLYPGGDVPIEDRVAFITDLDFWGGTIDLSNVVMYWDGSASIAMFTGFGWDALVGFERRGCGPMCEQTLYLLDYEEGEWMDLTDELITEMTEAEREELFVEISEVAGPGYGLTPEAYRENYGLALLYEFGRDRKSIYLYDQYSRTLVQQLTWDSDSRTFEVEDLPLEFESYWELFPYEY